ncbi:MAG: LysM peptidoglycan-binding domain-containing protein [Ilumatobacteraceae bacterium]
MSSTNAQDLRSRRRVVRVGALAGPLAIGALLLGACGGSSDDGASQSTIALSQESTAFVVRPPVTTLAPADTVLEEGAVSTAAQEYTIQSGDYPLKVANQFGVSVDELVAFNEWGSVDEFPFPGTVIQIPPGATIAGATTTTIAAATTGGGAAATTTAPAVTIPDAGDNCGEGEYTIVDGDYEGKVAANFDVTVDALRAANASTSGYSAFYPGLTIVIPGKADC